jgi:hypothetical protein
LDLRHEGLGIVCRGSWWSGRRLRAAWGAGRQPAPEELREHVNGRPVGDLRKAIASALPSVDPVTVVLVADWLLADGTDTRTPLGADQIAENWRADQRRAQ